MPGESARYSAAEPVGMDSRATCAKLALAQVLASQNRSSRSGSDPAGHASWISMPVAPTLGGLPLIPGLREWWTFFPSEWPEQLASCARQDPTITNPGAPPSVPGRPRRKEAGALNRE